MLFEYKNVGKEIYDLAVKLYPINRSIMGEGNRETLRIIRDIIPEMEIKEIPSGTEVFDWTIPEEWEIREAWIKDNQGNTLIDFKEHNLHVVGYSTQVNAFMNYNELQQHLYSREDMPDVIPYVTSYYARKWGFCLSHNQRLQLKENEQYHVYIDSSFNKNGSLSYGELLLKGKTEKEIFISSYICHPSLANNELSGPCLLTYLAKAIIENRTRYYSYRIILIPETIGAIAYISMHLSKMKENIVAGFNLTCVGDNRDYSFMPSRNGDTIIDRIAKHVLFHMYPEYKEYSYLQRGSDERQYCSSGVDLPVISMMRTKYAEYPEYHTSDDNLTVISPEGFDGSYKVHIAAINAIENNWYPKSNTLGEPQMGKRGLRPDRGVSNRISADSKLLLNLMAYADGKTSLFDIANIFGVPIWRLYDPINLLVSHQLLQLYDYPSD